jgi:hypothetical protein
VKNFLRLSYLLSKYVLTPNASFCVGGIPVVSEM